MEIYKTVFFLEKKKLLSFKKEKDLLHNSKVANELSKLKVNSLGKRIV